MRELTTGLCTGTRHVVHRQAHGHWQRDAVVWAYLKGAVIRQVPYIGDHIMEKP